MPKWQERRDLFTTRHGLPGVPSDPPCSAVRRAAFFKISAIALRLNQHFEYASAPALVDPSPGPAGGQPRIRVNGQPAGGEIRAPAQLTIWVDKRSFLPLRMEVRDSGGVIIDRSEVTSVEYDVSIPSGTFTYAPPADVSVATFMGGDGADVKRAMAPAR